MSFINMFCGSGLAVKGKAAFKAIVLALLLNFGAAPIVSADDLNNYNNEILMAQVEEITQSPPSTSQNLSESAQTISQNPDEPASNNNLNVDNPEHSITITRVLDVYQFEDLNVTISDYTVKKGDFLARILKKNGLYGKNTNHSQIMRLVKELNPDIDDLEKLKPGQVLKIPMKTPEEQETSVVESYGEVAKPIKTYTSQHGEQKPAEVVLIKTVNEVKPVVEEVKEVSVNNSETNEVKIDEVIPVENSAQKDDSTTNSTTSVGGNEGPVSVSSSGIKYRTIKLKPGDTLEKLLKREGLDADLIYRHLLKVTKELNPDLKNPNVIIAGAELRIPVEGEYLAKYNANRPKVAAKLVAPPAVKDNLNTDTKKPIEKPIEKPVVADNKVTAEKPKISARVAQQKPKPIKKPIIKRLASSSLPSLKTQAAKETLNIIFSRFGEDVKSKGRLFLPLKDGKLFDIDTADLPVLELKNGKKIVLDLENKIKPELAGALSANYPEYIVFKPNPKDDFAKMLPSLWAAGGYYKIQPKGTPFTGGKDVVLSIDSDWLVWPTLESWNAGQPFVINLAPSADNGTPKPWVDFLREHGIIVVDLFKGSKFAANPDYKHKNDQYKEIKLPENPSLMAAEILKAFGFDPKVGMQLDMPLASNENKTSASVSWEYNGKKYILEFGDLSIEALRTLKKSGYTILTSAADPKNIIKVLLSELKTPIKNNYVLSGVSTGGPNMSLTIKGSSINYGGRDYLFTQAALPRDLGSLLREGEELTVLTY